MNWEKGPKEEKKSFLLNSDRKTDRDLEIQKMYKDCLWDSVRTTKNQEISNKLLKTLEKEIESNKYKWMRHVCETPKLQKEGVLRHSNWFQFP